MKGFATEVSRRFFCVSMLTSHAATESLTGNFWTGKRGSAQRQRDLGLGLETDLVRNSYLAPTFLIARPHLRQIQPIGHRQARIVIGDRQRHRDLTVVLLAKLAAILSRYPDR